MSQLTGQFREGTNIIESNLYLEPAVSGAQVINERIVAHPILQLIFSGDDEISAVIFSFGQPLKCMSVDNDALRFQQSCHLFNVRSGGDIKESAIGGQINVRPVNPLVQRKQFNTTD